MVGRFTHGSVCSQKFEYQQLDFGVIDGLEWASFLEDRMGVDAIEKVSRVLGFEVCFSLDFNRV